MHHDAVPLVVMPEDQEVLTQLCLKLLNAICNGMFLNGQRGVHEVDRAHGEGYAHGSHPPQASTLFQ